MTDFYDDTPLDDEDFEVDESIEPYCVGTKFHGNYDIPYREIPVGTLRVYGKVEK